jgi:hypothetical protein
LAGLLPRFLPEHVAHLLAHAMAPCPLAGRIGRGARLGEMPQIMGLTALLTAVGHDRGDGRPQACVFVAKNRQTRPLPVS